MPRAWEAPVRVAVGVFTALSMTGEVTVGCRVLVGWADAKPGPWGPGGWFGGVSAQESW